MQPLPTHNVRPHPWLQLLVVLSLAAAAQLGRAVAQEKSAQGNAIYLPVIAKAKVVYLPFVRRAPGHIYYVATIGSDSNPGTLSQPWRTIQKAADTMAAWDTCIVLAGSYSERVRVTSSGTSDGPISFWAQGTVTMRGFTVLADYVKLIGFDITDTPDDWQDGWGFFVEGSNCVVEGNYVHYCTWGGILLYADPGDAPSTNNCIVRNNRLYRNSQTGITVNGRNHLVEGNEIWGTIQYHPKMANPPGWVDADGMRFFGTGHIIRRNYIHDITYHSPENVDPHIDCFQTWGPAYDITFERNVCANMEYLSPWANGQGFMIQQLAAPVRNLTVKNCIIYAFRDMNVRDCQGLAVVNNTFCANLHLEPELQFGVQLTMSPNATIRNNIFYDAPHTHLNADDASLRGLSAGYNCVWRSDGQSPGGDPWPNDLWGVNPLFVNVAGGDFHLRAGSPCIDRGTALSQVTNDLDGVGRPQGPRYDIGAYEYVSGRSVAPASSYSFLVR